MRESYIKKVGWVIISGLFLGWVMLLGVPPTGAGRTDQIEKDLIEKKKNLKDLKKEITLTKKKEREIRGKESSILETLHHLEEELYQKERELKKMEAQLVQTQERLRQTKHQILLLSQRMNQTRDELFSRMVALYKMEKIPTEDFLLTSQSYLDLLMLNKYFRVILHYDTQLINNYRSQVALK